MLTSIRQMLEETLVRFGRSVEPAMLGNGAHKSRRPSHSARSSVIGTHDGVAKMFLSGPNVTPYFCMHFNGSKEKYSQQCWGFQYVSVERQVSLRIMIYALVSGMVREAKITTAQTAGELNCYLFL